MCLKCLSVYPQLCKAFHSFDCYKLRTYLSMASHNSESNEGVRVMILGSY